MEKEEFPLHHPPPPLFPLPVSVSMWSVVCLLSCDLICCLYLNLWSYLVSLLLHRVATPLPYFICELLCVSRAELENVSTISLTVVILHPHPPPSQQHQSPSTSPQALNNEDRITHGIAQPQSSEADEIGTSAPTNMAGACGGDCEEDRHISPPPIKKIRLSCDEALTAIFNALKNADAWILDIDLDFFSTDNPYRGVYSKVKR